MKENIYYYMKDMETSHWWFATQKKAIMSFMERHVRGWRHKLILDAGCGTGRFLDYLQNYGPVRGIEKNPLWAAYCREKGYVDVIAGSIAECSDINERFDMIVSFDVLEHVEQDQAALNHFYKLMKPGGLLFLSVPAGEVFFSGMEKQYGHYRRYNYSSLQEKLTGASFQVVGHAYFNFFLLVPIVMIRKICERLHIPVFDEIKLNPWLNTLLRWVASSELPLLRLGALPYGLTLMVCAAKTGGGQ